MIVSCPSCQAKFRLDPNRVVGDWTPLTCPRCASRFTVAVGDRDAIALVEMAGGELRDSIGERLREAGFAVKTVETEAAAAHYLALCEPDLVARGFASDDGEFTVSVKADDEQRLDGALPIEEFLERFDGLVKGFLDRREQLAGREREVRRAERLARTILSDIILYNPEEVEKGIADGTFHELLAEDLADARAYFVEQVHPDVLREVNHFETYLEAYLVEERRKRRASDQAARGDR